MQLSVCADGRATCRVKLFRNLGSPMAFPRVAPVSARSGFGRCTGCCGRPTRAFSATCASCRPSRTSTAISTSASATSGQ
eukprot:671126-Alexandrium_andersonii.AAC.1